jgi:hypothetical protein
MAIDERPDCSGEAMTHDEAKPWEDLVFTEPEPPPDWSPGIESFEESTLPPQIVRTVNVLPIPEHGLAKDDEEGIADFIVQRAKEGIGDIFEHEDYFQIPEFRESSGLEAFARNVAEHQTGIPYTQPAYFYSGGQKAVASAIASDGRYPLAGQCQQSVTTALCIGGWDGGPFGDIGSGIASQPFCAKLGKGWTTDALRARSKPGSSGLVLADWHDDLWREIGVGTCLFWSAPCPMTKDGQTCTGSSHVPGCGQGSGHVVVVLRKHPTERKWQLWDTTTSFSDPAVHAAAQKGARMLWESRWWAYIPQSMQQGSWPFRGLGKIAGITDQVLGALAPRGRCRLILRRRSDHALLYRSDWLSMEREGLPISWLLRSMRGAPHCDEIEPTWCIDSPGDGAKKPPIPLLDCTCDEKGNAKMTWAPNQGSHKRPMPTSIWNAPGRYPAAEGDATTTSSPTSPASPDKNVEEHPGSPRERGTEGALRHAPLAGNVDLEAILAGRASAIHRGSKGNGVRAVQQALMTLQYDVPGGADGAFGAGTEAAIKAFQKAKNLGADGQVGKATLRALDDALDD